MACKVYHARLALAKYKLCIKMLIQQAEASARAGWIGLRLDRAGLVGEAVDSATAV